MSEIPSSYRLVQLDSPFDRWHDYSARQLFERMITLKIAGYGRKYPRGVMPFDNSCWYASHFLVCEDRAGLQPIMGFQRVTLKQYNEHFAPFAPLSSCRQVGCGRHIQAMEELVARFEDRPEKLSYTSSFTIDPKLRADRELVEELSRLMVVLHYLFHEEAGGGHEIISAPVTRFKVDSLLANYGFFPLVSDGEEGIVNLAIFAGIPVRFMRIQRFNREMPLLAERYRSRWEDRVLLGCTPLEKTMVRVPAEAV